MLTVPAAEFQKHIGLYQDKALIEPVAVTRNGRERLVLLSAVEYTRLRQLDRQAILVGDLTAMELRAIQAAEVPQEYRHLDAEVAE